jgi:hypothetical protein
MTTTTASFRRYSKTASARSSCSVGLVTVRMLAPFVGESGDADEDEER